MLYETVWCTCRNNFTAFPLPARVDSQFGILFTFFLQLRVERWSSWRKRTETLWEGGREHVGRRKWISGDRTVGWLVVLRKKSVLFFWKIKSWAGPTQFVLIGTVPYNTARYLMPPVRVGSTSQMCRESADEAARQAETMPVKAGMT